MIADGLMIMMMMMMKLMDRQHGSSKNNLKMKLGSYLM